MKRWYIITEIQGQQCEFVAISQTSLTLVLKYRGVRVKIKLHDFNDYRNAVNGIETDAVAISPKGTTHNKTIKIIFK